MHEMALAEGIIEVVNEAAGDQKVRRVFIRIGKLHAVVQDSFRFSYELAAADTSTADALLEIEEVQVKLRCKDCAAESTRDMPPFHCMACGSSAVEMMAGDELSVETIELEDGTVLQRPDATHETLVNELHEHARTEHGSNL